MNFGFSGEMIFIFLLALILFGPKKMPEIARQIARVLNEFRRASNEFRAQIESEVNSLELNKTANAAKSTLQPLKQPLGSLASRILNPSSGEKKSPDSAASAAADTTSTATTMTNPGPSGATNDPPPAPSVEVAASNSASKVAADA
jgi:sec-independent protein translocase protein TatB